MNNSTKDGDGTGTASDSDADQSGFDRLGKESGQASYPSFSSVSGVESLVSALCPIICITSQSQSGLWNRSRVALSAMGRLPSLPHLKSRVGEMLRQWVQEGEEIIQSSTEGDR